MATLFGFLLLGGIIGLIIGLISPQTFEKLFKKIPTRKQLSLIFGGVIFVSFILIGIFADPVETDLKSDTTSSQQTTKENNLSDNSEMMIDQNGTDELSADDFINQNSDTESSDQSAVYSVVSVVDGDTIKVSIDGKTETLRLIGIDTPETVDPRKPVQCFGTEASNKAKELLSGKKVRLEADSTQGELDKYDRLLRYVFLEDGTFFNKEMIALGYAHEYTYQSNPYKYQADFKVAEKDAREQSKGLWNPSTCNGDTTKEASNTGAPSSATTVITQPTSTPPSTPTQSGGPAVKKSTSKICHTKGTQYYDRTTNYVAYDSIEACIASGGRLPK